MNLIFVNLKLTNHLIKTLRGGVKTQVDSVTKEVNYLADARKRIHRRIKNNINNLEARSELMVQVNKQFDQFEKDFEPFSGTILKSEHKPHLTYEVELSTGGVSVRENKVTNEELTKAKAKTEATEAEKIQARIDALAKKQAEENPLPEKKTPPPKNSKRSGKRRSKGKRRK